MSNTATKTKPKAKRDPALQALLQARITKETAHHVAKDMEISRESILRYVHNEPLHTATLRGIEATLRGYHLPEASKSGLRR